MQPCLKSSPTCSLHLALVLHSQHHVGDLSACSAGAALMCSLNAREVMFRMMEEVHNCSSRAAEQTTLGSICTELLDLYQICWIVLGNNSH